MTDHPRIRRTARPSRCTPPLLLLLIAGVGIAWQSASVSASAGPPDEDERGIDYPMHWDPRIDPYPTVTRFDPRLLELWKKALSREESEPRARAAEAVIQAHREGWTELAQDAGLAALLRAVASSDTAHPAARRAAMDALAALDLRESAPILRVALAGGDPVLTAALDPVLARWGDEPSFKPWLQRLEDASVSAPMRVSAARALGRAGAASAGEAILNIVARADENAAVRLASASALETMAWPQRDQVLNRVAGSELVDRLVVARTLGALTDSRARQRLESLTADPEAVVRAAAAESLMAGGPPGPEFCARLAGDADPRVRLLSIPMLLARSEPASVDPLARLLSDVSPEVRRSARAALLAVAEPHGPAVRRAAIAVLDADDWRGLEQAALLLSRLQETGVADRLVHLLTHDRPEVRLASIVALRRLGVARTFPALRDRLEALMAEALTLGAGMNIENMTPQRSREIVRRSGDNSREIEHLCLAAGVHGLTDCRDLLQKMVPKKSGYQSGARAAAVWALGKLHDGRADEGLTRALIGRLNDLSPLEPESTDVRRASAIALGRMGARSAVASLRKHMGEDAMDPEVAQACRWAIERITGQPEPPPQPIVREPGGWFLQPVR